jgi:hypothetical protein
MTQLSSCRNARSSGSKRLQNALGPSESDHARQHIDRSARYIRAAFIPRPGQACYTTPDLAGF